jgi:hypothetical protein
MMIKDALAWLKEHLTDQAKVVPTIIEGVSPSSRKKYVWDPAELKMVLLERDPPELRHVLHSVHSLIAWINNQSHSARTHVWVGEAAITVECIEGEPQDILTLPMKHNPLFALLKRMGESCSYPQHEAVKLLRQQFSPFDTAGKTLTAIRNLKISTTDNFEAETSNVTAKLGRSVVQQAAGAGDLPEYIDVKTTVYHASQAEVQTIRVWTSLDFVKRGNIIFEPDTAKMEEAALNERLEIIEQIITGVDTERDCKVYEGEYKVAN